MKIEPVLHGENLLVDDRGNLYILDWETAMIPRQSTTYSSLLGMIDSGKFSCPAMSASSARSASIATSSAFTTTGAASRI